MNSLKPKRLVHAGMLTALHPFRFLVTARTFPGFAAADFTVGGLVVIGMAGGSGLTAGYVRQRSE